MPNQASVITRDTLIPIGAVVIVLGAAFSYGQMSQQVASMQKQLDDQSKQYEMRFDALSQKVDTVNQSIATLNALVSRLTGSNTLSYVK